MSIDHGRKSLSAAVAWKIFEMMTAKESLCLLLLCIVVVFSPSLLLFATATRGKGLPEFIGPYKMTFASSDPIGAQAFALTYLNSNYTDQPHEGGDGECAMIKWVYFPNTTEASGRPDVPYEVSKKKKR